MNTMSQHVSARLADFFFGGVYALQQRLFDKYMGTSTIGFQLTDSGFNVKGGDNLPYEGCMWPALERSLAELNPSRSDVFVDIGSGKGKGLLVAGRLPYGRVVGVELDAALAESARQNVAKACRKLKVRSVDVEQANALEWKFSDDISVVFMFNPFLGQTFRDVVATIFSSYDRNPRGLHVVYEHPMMHDWLVGTGRVVVESVRSSTWPNRRRWWESGDVMVTYHVIGEKDSGVAVTCVSQRRVDDEAMKRWSTPNGHRFGLNTQTLAAAGLSPREIADLKLPSSDPRRAG